MTFDHKSITVGKHVSVNRKDYPLIIIMAVIILINILFNVFRDDINDWIGKHINKHKKLAPSALNCVILSNGQEHSYAVDNFNVKIVKD